MRISVWVLLAGCGHIGFDTVGTTCWPSWESGAVTLDAPQPIAELAAPANRLNASLSPDALQLYFDDDSSGSRDIWRADRADLRSPWTNAAPVSELESAVEDGRITVDASGFAVFESTRGGLPQLWYATSTAGTFATPGQAFVGNINSLGPDVHDPELHDAGLALYMSLSPVSPDQNIGIATRATTSSDFVTPTVLSELSISVAVADPTLSPDEHVIVFTSGAPMAQRDLYYATRASTDLPFSGIQPVPEVNTVGFEDSDGELSPNGCELYFTSDRGGHPQLFLTTVLGP